MWFHHALSRTFRELESLDFQQVIVLAMLVIAAGWICLRGFGSRSNY
jgi:hypothetical protein